MIGWQWIPLPVSPADADAPAHADASGSYHRGPSSATSWVRILQALDRRLSLVSPDLVVMMAEFDERHETHFKRSIMHEHSLLSNSLVPSSDHWPRDGKSPFDLEYRQQTAIFGSRIKPPPFLLARIMYNGRSSPLWMLTRLRGVDIHNRWLRQEVQKQSIVVQYTSERMTGSQKLYGRTVTRGTNVRLVPH